MFCTFPHTAFAFSPFVFLWLRQAHVRLFDKCVEQPLIHLQQGREIGVNLATKTMSIYPITKCEKAEYCTTCNHLSRLFKLVSAAKENGKDFFFILQVLQTFEKCGCKTATTCTPLQKNTNTQPMLPNKTKPANVNLILVLFCIFQAAQCSHRRRRVLFALWTVTLAIWQGHTQTHLPETANTPPLENKVHGPRSASCDWKLKSKVKVATYLRVMKETQR